jgi:hypothetical protein
VVGALLDSDELRVPAHRQAPVLQPLTHDPFIVILAEDEDVRIRRHAFSGVAQGRPRYPAAVRPQIGARADLAELECAADDAELRVDLQRPGLHAYRTRLPRGAGVAVDDHRTHATASELIRQHETRGARTDDEHIDVRRRRCGSGIRHGAGDHGSSGEA